MGTILKAIPKNPCMAVKKEEPDKGGGGASDDGQILLDKVKKSPGIFSCLFLQVLLNLVFLHLQVKMEKTDNKEEEEKPEAVEKKEVKNVEEVKYSEEQKDLKNSEEKPVAVGGRGKTDTEIGRLVMTVDGQQKQLFFGRKDLLTTATMLDGDKVRRTVNQQPLGTKS